MNDDVTKKSPAVLKKGFLLIKNPGSKDHDTICMNNEIERHSISFFKKSKIKKADLLQTKGL